jgi:hypothetical protein
MEVVMRPREAVVQVGEGRRKEVVAIEAVI